MSAAEAVHCRRCAGPAKGYKCDVCGAESPVHVETHGCGGSHCMPKCAGCYEAEALCECDPAGTPGGAATWA